ncbi:hypothetical protein [Nocardia aurantia]|uniref:Uncharacterized protein n=1 Tax=Nocardia aurantia TaxID=2585199 RepID=A0A7K0E0X9_9NOCA|nr:hypothetical protein [Nocardia aurantia]MQY31635.1 hypothetical protein [Nocardia aurantia]
MLTPYTDDVDTRITGRVEAETGVPVFDSAAVTVRWCLRPTGVAPPDPRWGSLLARPAP